MPIMPTPVRGKTGLDGTGKTPLDDDWILSFSNFRQAWRLSVEMGRAPMGAGIIVAQLDTGYTEHPELRQDDRYLIGTSNARTFFKSPHPDGSPGAFANERGGSLFDHGTATSGVLMSAEGRPSRVDFPEYDAIQAIHGVAPLSPLIWYRVEDFVALGDWGATALARAIYYILSRPVTSMIGVITISLALYPWTSKRVDNLVTDALAQARKQGVIVCAAAGQIPLPPISDTLFPDGLFDPPLPARDDNVIGCAGCRPDNAQSPMSCGFLGPGIDITAPAQEIWAPSTKVVDRKHKYSVINTTGTSYATAFVAGACALWQAHHGRQWLLDPTNYGPELIFPLFKHVLRCSAYKPDGWDTTKRGAGVLDVENLLAFELPTKHEIMNMSVECPSG